MPYPDHTPDATGDSLRDLRPCPCGRMTVNDCLGECGFPLKGGSDQKCHGEGTERVHDCLVPNRLFPTFVALVCELLRKGADPRETAKKLHAVSFVSPPCFLFNSACQRVLKEAILQGDLLRRWEDDGGLILDDRPVSGGGCFSGRMPSFIWPTPHKEIFVENVGDNR